MNFLTAIFITVGVLAGMALSTVYVTLIHDPQVIATARENYVQIAEKTAAEAKATEMERQLKAASVALADNQARQAADEAFNQQIDVQNDKDLVDYQKRLKDAKRDCDADADDADFFMRH